MPGEDKSLLERVGTDLEVELGTRQDKKRRYNTMRGLLHEDVSQEDDAEDAHSG